MRLLPNVHFQNIYCREMTHSPEIDSYKGPTGLDSKKINYNPVSEKGLQPTQLASDGVFTTSKFSLFSPTRLANVVCSVYDVAESIFSNIFPHVLTTSPWYVSRSINFHLLTIFPFYYMLKNPLLVVKAANHNGLPTKKPLSYRINNFFSKIRRFSIKDVNICKIIEGSFKKWANPLNIPKELTKIPKELKKIWHLPKGYKAVGAVTIFTTSIGMIDPLNLLPQNISLRLTIDTLSLVTTCLGGMGASISGVRYLNKGCNVKNYGLKNRISLVISGLIITSLGFASLYQAALTVNNLAKGLTIFNEMDPLQQTGILKSRALHTLYQPKSCNAVVVDGLSSEWGRKMDDLSTPAVEFIYNKCNVRYLRTENSRQFCRKLRTASTELGKVDLIAIVGHANSYFLNLNENYGLHGSSEEWDCIDKYSANNAQVALIGCNTATLPDSISQIGSRNFKGKKEVIGFASYYAPFLGINSYENERFKFECLFPGKEKSGGKFEFTPPLQGRSFVRGVQI